LRSPAAGAERLRCPLCGGNSAALPLPHPSQSMLSDGRIIARTLAKLSCMACGAAFHASETSRPDIREIYGSDYALAGAAPKSDAARARAYCRWIQSECSTPRSILEIGCGSGALLGDLLSAWPAAKGYGIDPALPKAGRSDDRIRLERGFVEDIPRNWQGFDLIVAVNVVEHVSSPGAFLAALQPRLAPNGKIVIVCPAAEPPNVELLFFDHLYSLTPTALRAACKPTSLVAGKQTSAPREIGDFQMLVFNRADDASGTSLQWDGPSPDLYARRQSYLERWSELDQTLLDRSKPGARLVAFGAGQTAALLRAYAPRTWARVGLIMLDDINEAWTLGPPIASYQDAVQNLAAAEVLIAASPHAQTAIADRLRNDGMRPIEWNDLIPN
jgi:SAM-dependent methyltransferase